ncbi:MAG: AMP-binding protein, partial [Deltaproteobacteria bacterium]
MGLYDYTLYSVIKRNARVHGDKPALICGQERISHREFLAKVDRLATGLLEAGSGKDQRIAVLAKNSLEYVYLFGAAAKIGAILLVINWRLNPDEIAYIISDGAPGILCVDPEFQSTVSPLIDREGRSVACFSMGNGNGMFRAFSDLMENDGRSPETDVSDTDGWIIIHTAAVHGRPRGALITHRGMILTALQLMRPWHLTEDDPSLVMLPLFHEAGQLVAMGTVIAGGCNVVLPAFDVDQALSYIEEFRVATFGTFPPILKTILDKAEEAGRDISSLKHGMGLEEPGTAKRFEQMTGGTFWAGYGQSETSGLVTLAPYFAKPGSAGMPGHLSEVQILDEDGNVLPTGQSGEIAVRGPSVFKGYWNLEEETEYTFRNGWHHTGDRGRLDEDGYLWFEGRAPEKELIKPGGENVYPAEVEKVIREHPLVEEVSVIGVPDSQWGEAIKAVCVLRQGQSLAQGELIEFVAARIARYKKPKHVVFVPELPKT